MLNSKTPVLQRNRRRNDLLQPFLKWAGGKRQLLPQIRRYIPDMSDVKTYWEPFIGAGAVLFDLQPKRACINDANPELVNCYRVIRDNVEGLIEDIQKHKTDDSEYYYRIRELDRSPKFVEMSDVEKASRIIFLNKTCFNGLFRVNSQGYFNVPFGNYRNPTIVDVIIIKAISSYLNKNDVKITNLDFEHAVKDAKRGDFVYFDPPYDPVSDTSSFTGYNLDKFGKEEQLRLKRTYDELHKRGCKLMLSNSSTPFIEEIYSEYQIIRIPANRNINSVGSGRGQIDEFLILNYESKQE